MCEHQVGNAFLSTLNLVSALGFVRIVFGIHCRMLPTVVGILFLEQLQQRVLASDRMDMLTELRTNYDEAETRIICLKRILNF